MLPSPYPYTAHLASREPLPLLLLPHNYRRALLRVSHHMGILTTFAPPSDVVKISCPVSEVSSIDPHTRGLPARKINHDTHR